MRKLWTVASYDLRKTFADPSIWVNLVLVPVALVLVIGFVNGAFVDVDAETGSRYPVDVVSFDDGALAVQFIGLLQQNPKLVVCMDETSDEGCQLDALLAAEVAAQRVNDGMTNAFVLIPPDFSQRVADGIPMQIVYRSQDDAMTTSPTRAAVESAVQQLSGVITAEQVGREVLTDLEFIDVDGQSAPMLIFTDEADRAAMYEAIQNKAESYWEQTPIRLDVEIVTSNGRDVPPGFAQSVPGMGTMYVMFNVLGGMVILVMERKQWTLQRLVVMPAARWQILGGKVLSRFLLGMIQYAVAFGAGFVFGLRYTDFGALLLLMIAFTACITALSFLLGTFVTTENQAGSLSLFISLTLAPLGGAWWPLEIIPTWMQTAALISPVGWAMRGFNDLMIYQKGAMSAALPIVVLLGAAMVMFVWSVTRFKYD